MPKKQNPKCSNCGGVNIAAEVVMTVKVKLVNGRAEDVLDDYETLLDGANFNIDTGNIDLYVCNRCGNECKPIKEVARWSEL